MKISNGLFEIIEKEGYGKENYTVRRLSDNALFHLCDKEFEYVELLTFNIDINKKGTVIKFELDNKVLKQIITEEFFFENTGDVYIKNESGKYVPAIPTNAEKLAANKE